VVVVLTSGKMVESSVGRGGVLLEQHKVGRSPAVASIAAHDAWDAQAARPATYVNSCLQTNAGPHGHGTAGASGV
jgi:hypothetical protein